MQTFGRLKLDVDNCVRELADFGVAQDPGTPPRYMAARPQTTRWPTCSTTLERRATVSTEDQSRPCGSAK
jgi:hypothetical protein